MSVRWDDLPAHLRDKAVPKKSRRTANGKGTFRCHACGNEETAWTRAERHADETGHARIECVLPKL